MKKGDVIYAKQGPKIAGKGEVMGPYQYDYEERFRKLIAALALPRGRRRYARLTLLGALNGAQTWYRPDGDSPAHIARRVLGCLREPLGVETQ